jgi:hypothetical protein
MLIVTPADAPVGLTDINVPSCTTTLPAASHTMTNSACTRRDADHLRDEPAMTVLIERPRTPFFSSP